MKLKKEDNIPSEIIPNVFLGSVGCAFDKETLLKYGITHILTAADNI